MPPPRNVVILRASRLGDFICATPALRALRAALPQAHLALIGLPFARDLVARSPYLDRFIEFPGFPGIAEQFFEPRRALAFFERMQAEEFDLAIQLHGSGVYSNPFARLLGARSTAGFVTTRDWAQGLDAACVMPDGGHELDRWLSFMTWLGAPSRGRATEFPLWPQDRRAAQELTAGAARPLIGLHAGARDASKRWPLESFAAAARALAAEMGGTLVLLGDLEDRVGAGEVARQIGVPCLDLVGRTSIPQLGAVIERLDLLLANDSGPAHIAYALGTPSVTIFTATDPSRWGPLDLRRHHVLVQPPDEASRPRASAAATVDRVVAAAIRLLHPAPEAATVSSYQP